MDPNEFGKLFRLFLGLPSYRHPRDGEYPYDRDERASFPLGDEDPRSEQEDRSRRNFSVLTDPLEIHRFFEQQMDDMLKNFGGLGRERGGRGAISLEPSEEEGGSHPARDFMLKDEGQPRVDRDLDSEQVDMGELETLMRSKETRRGEEEYGRGSREQIGGLLGEGGLFGGLQGENNGFFGGSVGGQHSFIGTFGTSVVEQSISKPGGGQETSRIVRNSDGSEETTITRQMGDQVHKETTTREKDGSTTNDHRFINMEQSGMEQFNHKWQQGEAKEEMGRVWEVQPSPRQEMMAPPADQLYNSLWDKFWGN